MKKKKITCFVLAAVFCIGAASTAFAAQMDPPGAGSNLNNIGPPAGTNNTLPGNAGNAANPGFTSPGTQIGDTVPGTVPGNTNPGALPRNTVPGTLPGNTAPGTLPGNNIVPGTLPGNTVPGTLPGNTAPGTLPGNTAPGTLPGNTVPGTLPGNTVPGTLPGNTAPGTLPGNTAPGTLPGSTAPGTLPGNIVPGTLPGNTAPGIINPNAPYNSGTNLPGTGTDNPQVGGATNDQNRSGEPWQKVPAKLGPEHNVDPVTGRTRPLLKASPVPGKIDVYNVQLHDTLWIISRKYGIKLDAVIDANPELPDPDIIYPGDQIKVPLDPKINEELDIADSHVDKGDGSTKIRSNIIPGRYAGIVPQSQENAEEKELLDLVNNERAKAGHPPLQLSTGISTAARLKADEMCTKKYFNHTSPVYGSPFEMLRAFGIPYRIAGENIAKGQKSAKAVMGAWMSSEGHRANILNPDFKEIGIGYANDGKITYWVQIFTGK